MSRRGRPPQPAAKKILNGNPGKRRIPPEPKLRAGSLIAPEYLDRVAKEEWNRVAPELHRCGILKEQGTTVLAAYCQAKSRWLLASKKVEEYGLLAEGSAGNVIVSPYIKIANAEREAMVKYADKLGMTPQGLSGIAVDDEPEAKNPFESLLNKPPAASIN